MSSYSLAARRLPAVTIVAWLVLALLPLGVALASQLAPPAAGPVAAVFPPWWTSALTFASASQAGPVMRFAGLPFIVVVAASDRTRLHAAGAWLLLDPAALAGCGRATPADPA